MVNLVCHNKNKPKGGLPGHRGHIFILDISIAGAGLFPAPNILVQAKSLNQRQDYTTPLPVLQLPVAVLPVFRQFASAALPLLRQFPAADEPARHLAVSLLPGRQSLKACLELLRRIADGFVYFL